MDKYVLSAIDKIAAAPELSGTVIFRMQEIFPDTWYPEAKRSVVEAFPNVFFDFEQGMAYDSMHLSPAALHLFAYLLSRKIEPLILSH